MTTIYLPQEDRSLKAYQLKHDAAVFPERAAFESRIAYSAAHVAADPLADAHPILGGAVDWEATLAYRRHLWSLGFGVAEAMDTAQRGMGLTWEMAQELIRHSAAEAKAEGGIIASGAGTDQLDPDHSHSKTDIIRAYEEQCEFIESRGSRIIIMASRQLAKTAQSSKDYQEVYGHILGQVKQPVVLHWLGPMFDPQLDGYWGTNKFEAAMDTALEIIHKHQDKIDGIKISLLDKQKEIDMRRQLPESVKMYTGDDFNYAELIAGDEAGHSHALLGIFDAIAPAAAAALTALDGGDLETYHRTLEKTVPLSRHIFQKPTFAYKTGIVFLAYLNGYQDHFRMIGGAEGARSVLHLTKLFQLADEAGLLRNPQLAAERMELVLRLAGIKGQVVTK